MKYGSDIGGSIRTPCHSCGLFGHKPTSEVIPQRGHFPPVHGALSSLPLNVVGPLAKNAKDLKLAFDLTVGLETKSEDGLSLKLPIPRDNDEKGLRVGISAYDPFCSVDVEISSGIKKAAYTLEAKGPVFSDVTPDFSLSEHHEVYLMHLAPIGGAGYPEGEIEAFKTLLEKSSESDNSPEVVQDRGTPLPYRLWLIWNEMRAYFLNKWIVSFLP